MMLTSAALDRRSTAGTGDVDRFVGVRARQIRQVPQSRGGEVREGHIRRERGGERQQQAPYVAPGLRRIASPPADAMGAGHEVGGAEANPADPSRTRRRRAEGLGQEGRGEVARAPAHRTMVRPGGAAAGFIHRKTWLSTGGRWSCLGAVGSDRYREMGNGWYGVRRGPSYRAFAISRRGRRRVRAGRPWRLGEGSDASPWTEDGDTPGQRGERYGPLVLTRGVVTGMMGPKNRHVTDK